MRDKRAEQRLSNVIGVGCRGDEQTAGRAGGPHVRSPCGCVAGLQVRVPSCVVPGPGAWRMVPRGAQGGLPGRGLSCSR